MPDFSDSPFPVRILRPLAAKHIVIETGFEAYLAGPVSKAFAIPALRSRRLQVSVRRVSLHLSEQGLRLPCRHDE